MALHASLACCARMLAILAYFVRLDFTALERVSIAFINVPLDLIAQAARQ